MPKHGGKSIMRNDEQVTSNSALTRMHNVEEMYAFEMKMCFHLNMLVLHALAT